MADETRARARYTFGPVEHRGLIGSLRATQTTILGAALFVIVLVVATLHDAGGMLIAFTLGTATLAVVFLKVRGRTLEAWVPVVARFVARRASGHADYRSAAPAAGMKLGPHAEATASLCLPEELADLDVLAATVDPAGAAAI